MTDTLSDTLNVTRYYVTVNIQFLDIQFLILNIIKICELFLFYILFKK